MKVSVDQIPDGGLQVRIGREDPWAAEAARSALEGAVVALEGLVELRRYRRDLTVGGAVRARIVRSCDRCGETLELEIDDPLELTYVPDLGGGAGSRRLGQGELDLGVYEDGVLDLALVIQEHLALHLPWRVTCETPGAHPSGAPCTPDLIPAVERTPDPRWAALAELDLGEDN